MLYHLAGIDKSAGHYTVSGYPGKRGDVKLAFNISLNCDNQTKAIKALRNECQDEISLPPGFTEKELLQVVMSHHQPIKDYFFTGMGLRLQNIDSQLAIEILQHFTKQGISVLPVHDSFIIQEEYAAELKQVMEEVYTKRFRFKPVIDFKQ